MGKVEIGSEQNLISLPRRGLKIIAPEHTQKVMVLAQKHLAEGTRFTPEEKKDLWLDTEKARLRLIIHCPILKNRYPTSTEGKELMENVDYKRRLFLLNLAIGLVPEIIFAWKSISSREEVAIVLFGSVAKGLVKKVENLDPSNIDLAVMGNISQKEREELLDQIRPARKRVQELILTDVPFINSSEKNPGNVGVIVQNTEVLTRNYFQPTKNYIASCAFPLYDPTGIWQGLEQQALLLVSEQMRKERHCRRPKSVYIK